MLRSHARPLVLLTLVALTAACGSAPSAIVPGSATDAKVEASADMGGARGAPEAPPEMGATPYTAEQIRDATRAGRKYVFAIEADGAPPKRRTMRFLGVDASGALIESETASADGRDAVAEPASRATWAELRDHAAFPKASVTVSEGTTKTRAGEFACLVYTVRGPDGETTTFHFARDLPGPPVLYTTERDGRVLTRTELVAYEAGGASAVAASGTAKAVSLRVAMKLDGDVDTKALVAALQPQLGPLDACVERIPRSERPGSINARVTLGGQAPVTVRLESPLPPEAERCFVGAFAAWKVEKAGAGSSMILLELAP